MEPKTVRCADGESPTRHESIQRPNALTAGTVVLTLDGALPVEFLSPGDRVITRDSGFAKLVDIKVTKRKVPAVGIRAGSLGNSRPDRDAVFPASQNILIRDWRAKAIFGRAQALVPASRLVDGEFVSNLGDVEMTLCELIFDTPHIVYADGIEVASSELATVDA